MARLGSITQWVPAALCWMVAIRTRFRRAPVVLAAAAVTSYAMANQYYLVSLAGAAALPFPSPADVGYLLFFPLMVGALWAFMHRQLRQLSGSVLLDSAVGALGAAAVLAVLLSPVLDSAVEGPLSFPSFVAAAFPLSDMVLVAVVVGIAATRGLRFGYRWTLLALGLMVLAASDVIYALRLSAGDYAVGTALDAGWAIGLTLVAVWVDGAERSPAPAGPAETRSRTLAAPAAATVAGLGVLILSSQAHVTTLAVTLAGLTIVFAAFRTQLAFRQLVKMADLRRLALTDDLTTLPNRRALYAEIPRRLTAAEGGRSALLLLDLDRFKEVNDSLGHDIGDRLLTEVGERFSQLLRPSDLLARLGGDEFAILLDNAGHDEAVSLAGKLHASLTEPFILSGIAVQTDVSIGIALYPDQGDEFTVLLRRADMAMYKAKAARTGHHVFRSTDDSHGDDRLRTLQELRTALTGDQMVLHFQPKIDLDTNQVNGVEALVRWNHPSRGLLSPDCFLELAEEAGLMRELTDVVLAQALDQAAKWSAQALTVAVESVGQLADRRRPTRTRRRDDRSARPGDVGPRAGDHRGLPDRGLWQGQGHPDPAARRRHPDLHRRLRHRLQLAGIPA